MPKSPQGLCQLAAPDLNRAQDLKSGLRVAVRNNEGYFGKAKKPFVEN
jgi:hypothetical protein